MAMPAALSKQPQAIPNNRRLSIMDVLNDKRKSIQLAFAQFTAGDSDANSGQVNSDVVANGNSNKRLSLANILTPRRGSHNAEDPQSMNEKRSSLKSLGTPRRSMVLDSASTPAKDSQNNAGAAFVGPKKRTSKTFGLSNLIHMIKGDEQQ